MKRYIFIIPLMAVLFFAACGQKSDSPSASAPAVLNSSDTLALVAVNVDRHWPVHGEDAYCEEGYLTLNIQYPDPERYPLLSNSVLEWLYEEVASRYDGPIAEVEQMLSSDLDTLNSRDINLDRTYETADLVTFVLTDQGCYCGAAHGGYSIFGATFRKSDGKILGWNMFPGGRLPNEVVKKGLKEYFAIRTDAELEENLMLEGLESVNFLPMAKSQPWIEADGIHFVYQQYEIACYASGMPSFNIPLAEASKFLTPHARQILFEK